MRRAVSCILLLSLLLGMVPVSAIAQGSAVTSVPFTLKAEIDPEKTYVTAEVPYGDSLFETDATEYNHLLARSSMGLAMSNFRQDGIAAEEQGYAVRDFLTRIGFTDLQADQYDVDTTSDTVASTIGSKEIVVNGEPCTLIAVSVCGIGYENEWLSNFAFSEEDRHAGFDSASDKVLGRLLLYLFNHPAEERVKIWISGFSRAAAIANLLGQKLSNEKICPVGDLYVYTFASPNTCTTESEWPCPSVFNIVGSFDPVPTVPPAEWGYMRYGTTLYLPAQEVDSEYSMRRRNVERIFLNVTGVEYWNNPNGNWLLQKLLQILYSNIRSAQIYSAFVKDIITDMWVTSGILPRVRLLSDIMTANVVTDSSVRSLFASFKQVLSPWLFNLHLQGKTEDKHLGKGVSLKTQLMHEHYPAVYYAWMMSSSDPSALFLPTPSYYRVPVLPSLAINGISYIKNGKRRAAQDVSVVPFDTGVVLNIPADCDYRVHVTAKRDIDGETMTINGYTLPSLEANATIVTMRIKAGESAELVFPKGGIPEIRKGTLSDEADVSVVQTFVDADRELLAAVSEYSQSSWLSRNFVDLLLWIPVLLLALLAYLLIRVNIRRKKKIFYVRRAFLSIMAVFFCIDQILRNYFPWGLPAIIICQGICSVTGAVIAFFAFLRKRDRYTLAVLFAILFWTAGDVITKSSGSVVGTACYGAGHILLCIAFLGEKRPTRSHWMVFAASAALVYAVEIMTRTTTGELIVTMVYSTLLLAMTILSSLRGKAALASSLLFVFSDLLLTFRTALNAPAWLFLLTLGACYLSIAILSYDAYGDTEYAPNDIGG